MRLRLTGSKDLIDAVAAKLEARGITGRTMPSRYAATEQRYYADLDDRQVAQWVAEASKA